MQPSDHVLRAPRSRVAATELVRSGVPGVEALVDRHARRRRARWFARNMGRRTAEYRPVEQFTR